MAKPKVNSKELDKYEKYMRELWAFTKKLESMLKPLSSQEKVLAGGLVFQSVCPWGNLGMSVFIGEREMLAGLLNRTVQNFNQPPGPKIPPIFTDKDKPIN